MATDSGREDSADAASLNPGRPDLEALHDRANQINEKLTRAALVQQGHIEADAIDANELSAEAENDILATTSSPDRDREVHALRSNPEADPAAREQLAKQINYSTPVGLPGDAVTRYRDVISRRSPGGRRT